VKNRLNQVCPPLLPLVISLIAGIWAGVLIPFTPAWFILAGVICFFPVVVFFSFPSSLYFALLCFIAAVGGGVAMARIQTPFLPDNHISRFADGSGKIISGTVVSFSQHYPNKVRVVLACTGIEDKKGERIDVLGRIRLSIYCRAGKNVGPLPGYGDRIRFYSPLHAIRNFANGGYDYEARMRYLKIFGSAHVQAQKITIEVPESFSLATRFFRRAESMRNRFWFRVKAENGAYGDTDRAMAAAVLTALVTGKKEVLPLEVRDNFSRAGTSHLLAISGFHLSLVAFGVYLILNALLSRIYLWAVTGRARKVAGMLTLIPLTAYALFTGFSPSTQRALVMVSVFMVAVFMEKEKDPLNILCLAGIIILGMDPPALFSISFQLSFSALLFIILGFSLVYRWGVPDNRFLAWGAGMVLVTLFAGLGTFPLIARYFNMVSFIQLFSNLMVVPVMGFVCLPLGMCCLLLTHICPVFFHGTVSWLLNLILDILVFCITFIDYITGFEFSWARVVTPSLTDLVLIYLFMGAVCLAATTRKKATFLFLGLVVGAGLLSVTTQLKQRFFSGQLRVIVLDVGQGNATVVMTPGGRTLLIDGGGFPGRSTFDTGRFIIGPFLWRHWIKSIDAVVLSHPQSDHMNGLVFVMENFRVNNWIHTRDKNKARSFEALLKLAKRKGVPQLFPSAQIRTLRFDKVSLSIFPLGTVVPNDLNNNSLVCRLSYGDFSMLFVGDIEFEREMALVRESISLASRILMAPHHGSQSSSSEIFLDKVSPQEVIISCGYKNRYGFPHPVILERYLGRGMKIFRTDLQGAVTVTSSGKGYHIRTHRNE